jgi:hypothetical protein
VTPERAYGFLLAFVVLWAVLALRGNSSYRDQMQVLKENTRLLQALVEELRANGARMERIATALERDDGASAKRG